jgi:calcium-dependent protein kinase
MVEKDAFAEVKKNFSNEDVRTKYKFLKVLGGGHFGTVRLGAPKDALKNFVAIKSILKSSIVKDIKHLEEELFILSKINHPNIIRFHETYIDHRYIHIVMEACTGGELFDRIVKNNHFDEKYASDLMKQMLSSIKHMHDMDIVHRDLKPENFLMADKTDNSEVKLIDFGLSKRLAETDHKMSTVVGTPYYVAPEVL